MKSRGSPVDRDAFLQSVEAKLQKANAVQEQKLQSAAARRERMKEIAAIIKPYDDWFHDNHVRTSLNTPQPAQLTWILPFADDIAMALTITDDDAREALELNLSITKGGHPALYVELPFGHGAVTGQHLEAKAAALRLDGGWSAAAFEAFIQDVITAYLDDAPRHGGTALLGEDRRPGHA
jgi:hypothetical protein